RAADVADFLRAWGYSVPRELAKASSRTLLVLGSKETVALVSRALGDASPQPPATAGGPQGPGSPAAGLAGRGSSRPPATPGVAPGEQAAPKPLAAVPSAGAASFTAGSPVGAPLRHAAHPYDALVYAGAEPADVYVVDVRAVADEIDV